VGTEQAKIHRRALAPLLKTITAARLERCACGSAKHAEARQMFDLVQRRDTALAELVLRCRTAKATVNAFDRSPARQQKAIGVCKPGPVEWRIRKGI